VTIPTVIGAVALSCLTGFALASTGSGQPFDLLHVRGRQLRAVPDPDGAGARPDRRPGLYNTITGLMLFHIAFQTGFCTLFMRNFIRALPFELIEAARVEGVAEWRIFWYVVLPLMRPAIAALSVLIFTFIWNDYFWATC
jgi:multiple sugar transport system permease protein